jgi:hypothetical protein
MVVEMIKLQPCGQARGRQRAKMGNLSVFRPIDALVGMGIRKLKDSDLASSIKPLVHQEFDSLDAKASSLLQHVSIMVASLSISYVIIPPETLKMIALINILLYLIVVFLVLRVLSFVNFVDDKISSHANKFVAVKELKIRERYYLAAHSLASILTVIIIVSIAIILLYLK